ncbi:MAG: hypothetical protein J6K25_08270 [Thermoguttaceae bacterium]|nr:hypothetical protein [Thermoguttaceae bacterium]
MSSFPRFSRRRSFRFVVSGVAVVLLTATASTQAQTPTFNLAEYAEYNEKTDDAAASFADRVARRSAVAPDSNAQRPLPTPNNVQNAPTRRRVSNASALTPRRAAIGSPRSNVRSVETPKSQATRTWEAFLFGTPKRPVATPKFAFAQRDVAPSPVRVSRSHSPAASQTTQTAQPERPLQVAQTAQTVAPATDAEIAAARRRRLQELNAILASRRPEEFSRRLALKNVALVDDSQALTFPESVEVANEPALPILVADSSAVRPDAARQAQVETIRESADAPFDAARANRSKIRQASNLEPANSTEPLELADDGLATFLLPTRPNALRLSPNVFLSTDLVRLPSAAPLREAPESAPVAPTPQPTQSVRPARPLQSVQSPAAVATPLPAAPSTDVPTLRPTAQFVEPRFLPTSR